MLKTLACVASHRQDNSEDGAPVTSRQGTNAAVEENMAEREKNVTQADRWEEMFNCSLAFREKNGHCSVPTRCVDDPKLGKWGKCDIWNKFE